MSMFKAGLSGGGYVPFGQFAMPALAGAAGLAALGRLTYRKYMGGGGGAPVPRNAKAGGAPGGQPFPTQGYAPAAGGRKRRRLGYKGKRRLRRVMRKKRVFRKRVQAAMYPLYANQVYNKLSAFSLSTTNGRQSIRLLEDAGTPSQISDIVTAGALQSNSHIYLRQLSSQITITNQCNDNVWVELYYCRPRQDLSTSTYTNLNTVITSGFTDVNASGAELVFGTSLYDCPKFVNLVKIESCRKILMSAGTVHRCVLRAPKRHLLASENDTGDFLDKYSRFIVIKFHGSPLNGVSGDGQDTTVSVGPVKLDFIVNRNYRWKHIDQNQGVLTPATNLTQVTTPHIMQASGNIQAVNEANA